MGNGKATTREGLHLEELEPRMLLSFVGLDNGFDFLDEQLEQFAHTGDVYTEADAGGNLYAPSGWMNAFTGNVLEVDTASTEVVLSGQTTLRIAWTGEPGDDATRWAGVLFEWPDGLLEGTSSGDGWDLSGASALTFWAKSGSGPDGVQVGVGATAFDGFEMREWIILGEQWNQYAIDVSGHDLSNLNGGFVVVFNDSYDIGGDGVTVYLDDVAFNAPRADVPVLLQSYRPGEGTVPGDSTVYRNAAYVYDNSLAALAYMARGESDDWLRAEEIMESFHWILHHEQIDPGLEDYVGPEQAFLRSGYSSGPIADPATGLPRAAGWTDLGGEWHAAARTITTGDNAWVMIALLNYHRHTGEQDCLQDARLIGNWVHENWHDVEHGGYLMGLGMGGQAAPWPGSVKSTEHNIDVYAAFSLLAEAYGDLGDYGAHDLWQARAEDAADFVMGMYCPAEGRFYVGTADDGVTPNDSVFALDPQSWSVLALGVQPEWSEVIDWTGPLEWAAGQLGAVCDVAEGQTVEGFDFGATDRRRAAVPSERRRTRLGGCMRRRAHNRIRRRSLRRPAARRGHSMGTDRQPQLQPLHSRAHGWFVWAGVRGHGFPVVVARRVRIRSGRRRDAGSDQHWRQHR